MCTDPKQNAAPYLGHLVESLAAAPLEEDDRAKIRQHLLDSLAAGLIGLELGASCDLRDLSRLSPTDNSLNPADVAMLWACCINSSVFEDGSKEGACHPAAAVMPVVYTFGQGQDWALIDRAVLAGYDVMIRIARAGNPYFTLKGFHPTAIAAPFAAAAALAVLKGYDSIQTRHALSLAALGGAGLMAAFKCGPTQPLQVAWSVRNGVMAGLLAGRGHRGYERIIEEGYFPAYLGREMVTGVEAPLSRELAIRGSYLKPYPGCRHLHASLDALAALQEKNRLSDRQIARIDVKTYKAAVETEIHELNGRGDAYFNLPYAMAARIVLGHNDYDAFGEEHFDSDRIRALMSRVGVVTDAEIDALYPGKRGARVEVELKDGQRLSETILIARGEPENPLPLDFTRHKFRKAAAAYLPEERVTEVEAIFETGSVLEGTMIFGQLTHILATTQRLNNAV
jgi:2-methylcitrate dehydratase PrpD